MANKFEICSRASILVGGGPITGFTRASTEEVVAETLYESVLMNLLASYRWRFASQYQEICLLDDCPPLSWQGVFQLPPNVTVIHGAYVCDRPVLFDRCGDRLLAMACCEGLTILSGFRPDEECFPPYFTAVLELKLAGMFAVPIAEDSQKASLYEGMAMRQFAQARSIESQGRSASKLPVGGLRRLHGGRA